MADGKVEGYAGDLTPEETWKILKNEQSAMLIDVRTAAEWNYVGVADLSNMGKEQLTISWVTFPGDQKNENFIAEVEAACPDKDAKVISICRSGVRSISTSTALTEAGYTQAYNVLEGFEGDKNDDEHRGNTGGWKVRGLPWKQK
ncbi:MAG: rhodanese-like domain-containing protein [Rhodospirillales bacterium]|nr:rhodanese-like domain-containing protein [Rhodospirillales bacterium]HJO87846.1 rhodanese-like domain-containing protein [Rhodospirillales bacterium]